MKESILKVGILNTHPKVSVSDEQELRDKSVLDEVLKRGIPSDAFRKICDRNLFAVIGFCYYFGVRRPQHVICLLYTSDAADE